MALGGEELRIVETLGVGLIGCGGMGRSLGKQLIQLENARLIGVAASESRRRVHSPLSLVCVSREL